MSQMLLIQVGKEPMVVPLEKVVRLEEFSPESIERSGDMDVVQYRQDIMPILWLDACLDSPRSKDSSRKRLSVVVTHDQDRRVGFVVDQIQDIVEVDLHLESTGRRPGLLGTAVIREKVTGILDVASILHTAHGRKHAANRGE